MTRPCRLPLLLASIIASLWIDTSSQAAPPAQQPAGSATTAHRCTSTRKVSQSEGIQIALRMSGDGTCSVSTMARTRGRAGGGGLRASTSGDVTVQPQHGSVTLRTLDAASFADYTPSPGYVGRDHFEMRLLPESNRLWTVDINVGR